ncbi:MAG: SpoIIE family protein phosphatase [Bacteroidales bacterium]
MAASKGTEGVEGSTSIITETQDSLKLAKMLLLAEQLKMEQKHDSALAVIDVILETALESKFEIIEAHSYRMMGEIYNIYDEWEMALRYYLKAAGMYSSMGMDTMLAFVYSDIASKYYDFRVYNKAAEYYIKEYDVYAADSVHEKITAVNNIALSYFRDGMYEGAVQWFDKLEELALAGNDNAYLLNSLFGLTACHMAVEDYKETRIELEKLIDVLERMDRVISLSDAYISMALTYFYEGDYKRAIEYYNISVDLLEGARKSAHEAYKGIAICYQNMGNDDMMAVYFEKALAAARDSDDKSGLARLEHIMAVLSKEEGDYYHADYYCNAAIDAAESSDDYRVLQDCYLTYSEVLEEGNDFVRALEYYEKYLSLRDSLLLEERLAEQSVKRRRNDLESIEQQLLLSLADEELKDVMIDKLRVENEKRENELQLIERERELERSERERLEQSIALSRERYNMELQQQEIQNLEQEKAIQRLELIRKENEEKELLRKNQLQESEIRQQQLEIEKEYEARKRAIWMIVLLAIIAVLVIAGLISTRRKNIILSEQKNEITSQKDIIEDKNRSITDSIEYASRIQNAVLPPLNFLDRWNMENFILFRPKDIVSGDFYWGQEREGRRCFAAADCTGHGVPGAFMSMLGNDYLNDIINSRSFTSAGDILDQLRKEVIRSLKQKGEEGETQDGMDIALCLYDKQNNVLDFAGANNPLYMIREDKLIRFDADKMPIGIHRSLDKTFTNHRIEPCQGDIIYLFSDGFADQFGGPQGKKFKYRAFRELLLREHKKPMPVQEEILAKVFEEWKGDIEQVDDVLVIGVKF